jgi:hypothetical protein
MAAVFLFLSGEKHGSSVSRRKVERGKNHYFPFIKGYVVKSSAEGIHKQTNKNKGLVVGESCVSRD